jgi:hypothetical protein
LPALKHTLHFTMHGMHSCEARVAQTNPRASSSVAIRKYLIQELPRPESIIPPPGPKHGKRPFTVRHVTVWSILFQKPDILGFLGVIYELPLYAPAERYSRNDSKPG